MTPVPASYFDGGQARPYAVTIDIDQGIVTVHGDEIERREPLHAVHISDVLGNAPRLVRFEDGAFCEITDGEALTRLLAANGVAPTVVSQWEGSLRWIWAGAVAFLLVLFLGYKYGVPAAAGVVADNVPAAATRRLSAEVLTILDRQMFAPTEVPEERRDAIARAFSRLDLPSRVHGAEYTILFRKSELLGANAVALPSGTIVVTDGLVALAQDDRELLGVLAHEAGHVDRRHGLRNVLQNSIVGLAVAWFIGDVSTIAAAAPTALIQASYSRELEREADAYAVEVLRANDIPVRHLADILRRLEDKTGRDNVPGPLEYLSSHPATAERLQRLETR